MICTKGRIYATVRWIFISFLSNPVIHKNLNLYKSQFTA